jgi:hypothetical protein
MPREPFDRVLARSSLGRPAVRRLAARAPVHTVAVIRRQVADQISRDLSGRPAPIADRTASGRTPSKAPTTTKESVMASRKTSVRAASAASKVLRDGRTSKASKTAAASALSQRAPKSGKRR